MVHITANSNYCTISLLIPLTEGLITVHQSTLTLQLKTVVYILCFVGIVAKHALAILHGSEYHKLVMTSEMKIPTAGQEEEGDKETIELLWMQAPERRELSPLRITTILDSSRRL